jgi:hypothetical protein
MILISTVVLLCRTRFRRESVTLACHLLKGTNMKSNDRVLILPIRRTHTLVRKPFDRGKRPCTILSSPGMRLKFSRSFSP